MMDCIGCAPVSRHWGRMSMSPWQAQINKYKLKIYSNNIFNSKHKVDMWRSENQGGAGSGRSSNNSTYREKGRHWSWQRSITFQGKATYYPWIKNRMHSRDLISWERHYYDSEEADSDETLWAKTCDSI